ncbi:amidohydrolase family protein, partial [Microvirga sp. 3-52]|nr:amidohydrolase family protein [Microvirga sp. 3-52]
AVHLFTVGSVATIGKDNVRGRLQENFDADFTILDTDLFSVEDEGIIYAKVVMTVVAGDIVYE